jgi:hypothetical protein
METKDVCAALRHCPWQHQVAGKVTVLAPAQPEFAKPQPSMPQSLGLNLGYTINLNLPATSDPAVFNAIFKALKEHLLKPSND